MPFENVTRDSRIFWLSEASAVVLADDLSALGVDAMAREERREAFDRLQVPPAASLTDATVIRIGQLVGASQVVVGTLRRQGDTLIVNARSIALDVGRIQHNATEGGPISDLFAIFERVARTIAPDSARTTEEVERQHPPIATFENYIKGLLAATPATAINYLNTALRLQPTFARARLALWDVYTEQGNHDRALAAVERVAPGSPWTRRARFLAGLSQLYLAKHDDAFATYKALVDERPTAAVLNNLGVVQLRRGGTPQAGQPTYYFNKAAETEPTEPDYFFNLGYTYWLERDTQAAIHWLREAVRRNPADGEAHFVLGAALLGAGSTAEANRERELARRLSSTYAEWEKRPGPDGVPKGLERLQVTSSCPAWDGSIRPWRAADRRISRSWLAFISIAAGGSMRRRVTARRSTELNRALFLSPYDAATHLLVARIHLRGGRVQEAIDALKISLWSAETAEAHTVLAQAYLEANDTSAAHAEAERALALDPASGEAKRILERSSPP